MKKVLHIVESFGSGVFSFLVDLINETNKDFEIIVAYGKREETPKNFREYFNNNIKFIKIENFTRSINVKKDIKALIEIKKIIKEEKPDIVHLHSSKAGVLGRLAINGNKVKMFYNPHGFSFLKQDDLKLKRTIYWIIEKVTANFNKNCTIIGCSSGEYIEAKKLNRNSMCINNGINVENLKKETEKLEKRKIDYENLKICTVGRISYQKNPKIFNELAKEFPNIQFTWIGDGELRKNLTSSNIKVTGWKDKKELIEIVNNSDIFILPSLWEGLPISLLEAMALKKICIVSNVIGNRDVIRNEYNGFVCNDFENFKTIIQNIQNDKYDLIRISENAYNDIVNIYNAETMSKQYLKVYKETEII